MKKNRKMWTCSRLHLETIGSQLIMPKILHRQGFRDNKHQPPPMVSSHPYWRCMSARRPSQASPRIRENRQFVTDELVEVQDCRKITDHIRGISRINPNLIKESRRMSTCNRSDLQTLGSQLIMPKNNPDHWPSPRYVEWWPLTAQSSRKTRLECYVIGIPLILPKYFAP